MEKVPESQNVEPEKIPESDPFLELLDFDWLLSGGSIDRPPMRQFGEE